MFLSILLLFVTGCESGTRSEQAAAEPTLISEVTWTPQTVLATPDQPPTYHSATGQDQPEVTSLTTKLPQVNPATEQAGRSKNSAPIQPTPTPSKKPNLTRQAATDTIYPPDTVPPTPNPFADITIDALSARAYGGGLLDISETLERNDRFARYLITYPSDGLTIHGYMNVPNEGGEFPVVILLHGYIPPNEYETVTYTKRYADALAEAGYMVVHPNLRGYPPSDSGPDLFRTGMAVDVLNLIAIIREQSQDSTGYLRRADEDNIHLWGHSMGGGVALRVVTVNNEPYLRSALLYAAMSGDEALNYDQIRLWSRGRRGGLEATADAAVLQQISPINHLERLQAAISIHHSDADDIVPVVWSESLCEKLENIGQQVACFIYNGAPHTFHTVWDEVFIARTIDFLEQNSK